MVQVTAALGLALCAVQGAGAFTVGHPSHSPKLEQLDRRVPNTGGFARQETLVCFNSPLDDDETSVVGEGCWNPKLRRAMGFISGAGLAETAYLTFVKITGGSVLCIEDAASSCSDVLNGPYAVVPGSQIPLAAAGVAAYAAALFLSVSPLFLTLTSEQEETNRLQLTAVSTTMAVFSVFLMSLLFGVLEQSCAFCVASAFFSISLAKLSWLGGAIPEARIKQGVQWGVGGGAAAFVASAMIFFGAPEPSSANFGAPPTSGSTQLLASTQSTKGSAPPPILSPSSPRTIAIANDLVSLDARMFGAFWCSHCYDQKERLGREAMSKIPYIECSKDGLNSQNALCKSREVPGYPTWEIAGQLYPGEMELDELEEIIKSARAKQ